jgi:RecJ-like exonuclease
MTNKKGEIVTCQGCDGIGVARYVQGHEVNCVACDGLGKVRKLDNEIWCVRCSARGEVMKGTPGFERYGACPICDSKGRVEVK